MKQYQLIKTYPGSLPKNTIIEKHGSFYFKEHDDIFDPSKRIHYDNVENHPEFWNDISSPVLFKTEEGFNVRKGGDCFFIDTENYTIYSSNNTCIRPPDKFPVFLYKRNAERWIIFNTPCLSLNQIAQIYITANCPDLDKPFHQSTRIYNLVKQKLNIK